jgi:hypothetical protein
MAVFIMFYVDFSLCLDFRETWRIEYHTSYHTQFQGGIAMVNALHFSSSGQTSRDENLEANSLAAAENSRQERKPRPVVSLNFPPPPYHSRMFSSWHGDEPNGSPSELQSV